MGKGKYTEAVVVSQLEEKHDIRIVGKQIHVLRGDRAKRDIGIKTKGKIDFLTNYCQYTFIWVTDFKNS